MSKEKQIEEMAKITAKTIEKMECKTCEDCKWNGSGSKDADCTDYACAEALYNAGYRKQNEWISVEERLPGEDEIRDECGELIPFLVCCRYTQYPFRAVYDGTDWGDGIGRLKVTHWMPLPEPPKNERR